jgi:hypothetical protein
MASFPASGSPQLGTASIPVWRDQLAAQGREVATLLAGLAPNQLRWRPGPGRWSLAECLSHLAITARRGAAHWVPAIEAARARGLTGPGPFSLGWLGAKFVTYLGPNPKRPAPAPAIFAPPADIDPDTARSDFERTQDELRGILASAEGLDLSRVGARSAVTPLIRFNLAVWFAGTVAHQRRHLDQMKRIRNDPAFPPG